MIKRYGIISYGTREESEGPYVRYTDHLKEIEDIDPEHVDILNNIHQISIKNIQLETQLSDLRNKVLRFRKIIADCVECKMIAEGGTLNMKFQQIFGKEVEG